jgi:hypothetical protein
MKKILVVFICLIFSNTTFAIPGWFSPDNARCKISYTRLDLVTGAETIKKHTAQYTDMDSLENNCSDTSDIFAKKIAKWLDKSKNNIISNMTVIYCKTRTDDGIFSNVWHPYKKCKLGQPYLASAWLSFYYPGQIGYNVHPCRFLEATQEEIDNFYMCK